MDACTVGIPLFPVPTCARSSVYVECWGLAVGAGQSAEVDTDADPMKGSLGADL